MNAPEAYMPEERLIYSYYAGEKTGVRKCDPMDLYKRLMEVRGDLSVDMTVAKSPSNAAMEAHTKMCEKIRFIFNLVKFDEGGLLDGECESLLNHFWLWCDWVKKKSKMSPTSPDATSGTSPPPTEENPATSNTSDCG